jgi:hypothetical protein
MNIAAEPKIKTGYEPVKTDHRKFFNEDYKATKVAFAEHIAAQISAAPNPAFVAEFMRLLGDIKYEILTTIDINATIPIYFRMEPHHTMREPLWHAVNAMVLPGNPEPYIPYRNTRIPYPIAIDDIVMMNDRRMAMRLLKTMLPDAKANQIGTKGGQYKGTPTRADLMDMAAQIAEANSEHTQTVESGRTKPSENAGKAERHQQRKETNAKRRKANKRKATSRKERKVTKGIALWLQLLTPQHVQLAKENKRTINIASCDAKAERKAAKAVQKAEAKLNSTTGRELHHMELIHYGPIIEAAQIKRQIAAVRLAQSVQKATEAALALSAYENLHGLSPEPTSPATLLRDQKEYFTKKVRVEILHRQLHKAEQAVERSAQELSLKSTAYCIQEAEGLAAQEKLRQQFIQASTSAALTMIQKSERELEDNLNRRRRQINDAGKKLSATEKKKKLISLRFKEAAHLARNSKAVDLADFPQAQKNKISANVEREETLRLIGLKQANAKKSAAKAKQKKSASANDNARIPPAAKPTKASASFAASQTVCCKADSDFGSKSTVASRKDRPNGKVVRLPDDKAWRKRHFGHKQPRCP